MAYTPKLTYKGRPLVRCGNDIYYGSMKDPFVVYLQVLSTKKENGVDVADKVHIVLLSTDESTHTSTLTCCIRRNSYASLI